MKIRSVLSIVIIAWAIYFPHRPSAKRYKNAGKGYSLRITNINGCVETPNSQTIKYFKVVTFNNLQFANVEAFLENAISMNEIRLLRLLAQRCLDYDYGCENFANWTFPNPCTLITMKNQAWNPIVRAIGPPGWKRRCPYIEKGTYTVTNSARDVEAAIHMMPDILKYKWRITFKTIEYKRHQLQFCTIAEGHAVEYTKRINADRRR